MKRFQLLTTAIFLFCTLLIAGCTSHGVEAQATAAPEATPTATANIMSGIQTGDNEVNKILAGTWTFERTDADKKADDSSVSQILPDTDTGAKEAADIKEPGAIRELTAAIGIPASLTDAIRQAAKGKEVTAEEIESKIVPMAVDAMKSGNIAVNPRASCQQDIEALYRKAL